MEDSGGRGGAQQLADGDLQYLGQADQQGGVRDGQALLPLGNGLPDHMQTDGQIFLGQALGLPVGFEIFLEHRQKPPCISSLSIVNLPRCGKQRKETKGETG